MDLIFSQNRWSSPHLLFLKCVPRLIIKWSKLSQGLLWLAIWFLTKAFAANKQMWPAMS
jgi:hypothetical protein